MSRPNPVPRTIISPQRAMLESFVRTIIIQAVGAGLTWLVAWASAEGFDLGFLEEPENKLIVVGVVWTMLSGLYAAVQRKFFPIQTDSPTVARADVTSGGNAV